MSWLFSTSPPATRGSSYGAHATHMRHYLHRADAGRAVPSIHVTSCHVVRVCSSLPCDSCDQLNQSTGVVTRRLVRNVCFDTGDGNTQFCSLKEPAMDWGENNPVGFDRRSWPSNLSDWRSRTGHLGPAWATLGHLAPDWASLGHRGPARTM